MYIDSWELNKVDKTSIGEPEYEDVYVGQSTMGDSKEQKYLGDIISTNGSNDSNIKARKQRGFIIVNKICSLLESICFGQYYFEVALTLRNALLINSVLTNSGVWYKVTNKQIEQLEQVDEALLCCVLFAPRTTSIPFLYLELGCIPIRYLVMARRLSFLHYLMNQDKETIS